MGTYRQQKKDRGLEFAHCRFHRLIYFKYAKCKVKNLYFAVFNFTDFSIRDLDWSIFDFIIKEARPMVGSQIGWIHIQNHNIWQKYRSNAVKNWLKIPIKKKLFNIFIPSHHGALLDSLGQQFIWIINRHVYEFLQPLFYWSDRLIVNGAYEPALPYIRNYFYVVVWN